MFSLLANQQRLAGSAALYARHCVWWAYSCGIAQAREKAKEKWADDEVPAEPAAPSGQADDDGDPLLTSVP